MDAPMTRKTSARAKGPHDDTIARAVFDASPDCIKIIGLDGRLKHMNRAGCIALGIEPGKAEGIGWVSLLPTEIHEASYNSLRSASSGQRIKFYGLSDGESSGLRRWENMLTPLLSDHGKVEDILCISRDVTDEHAFDERAISEKAAYPSDRAQFACDMSGSPDLSPNLLSLRERECLFWVSLGKTAWETSVILALSRRTIEFHLANAIKKLGAANKHHAAMIALNNHML